MGVVTACFKALQGDCAHIGMNLKVDYRGAAVAPAQQGREGRRGHGPWGRSQGAVRPRIYLDHIRSAPRTVVLADVRFWRESRRRQRHRAFTPT